MRNRCGFWLLLSVATALTGCAATPRMNDGTPAFGTQAWNQAPAPPQRTIANTVPTAQPAFGDEPVAKPVGLTKYFPGLQRAQAAPPEVAAARYRPTWFGLRPNPSTKAAQPQPTTYMTDARANLARPFAEPSTLPVALQVPIPQSSSDASVKPVNVEQPMAPVANLSPQPASAVADPSNTNPVAAKPFDFGGKPSRPGEDDVNPLPPAVEPGTPATIVANRMPEVPTVNPEDLPVLGNPEPARAVVSAHMGPNPDAPSDNKTDKAITPPASSDAPTNLADPTVPASYASVLVAQQAVGFKKSSDHKVFASPQSPKPSPQVVPTPQARPSPQVKPTSQAVPTSLSKPSPQALPSGQSGATDPAGKTWKRPCFRRLVRKVCNLGEYADPPTAAPH